MTAPDMFALGGRQGDAGALRRWFHELADELVEVNTVSLTGQIVTNGLMRSEATRDRLPHRASEQAGATDG
jgi:hypothetical protein